MTAIIVIALVSSPKTHKGVIGGTMKTKWFSFTVTHAETVYAYDKGDSAYTAESGFFAVIADLSITNTCGEDLDILSDDFVLVSDDFTSQEYCEPVIKSDFYQYFDTAAVKMFRFEEEDGVNYFVIPDGATKTGRLVFVISSLVKTAKLDFTEFSADGKKGDTYLVNIF